MKKDDINKIVKLRKFLIEYYDTLDGINSPGSAIVLQRDVAALLESTVKSMDDILSSYVSFDNK